MEKFKRSFSMRKKRDATSESSKPHQWQEDERKVREGTCSFQVKYLGCIEVFESRGIQICEEAVKALKSRKSRSSWSLLSFRKKRDDAQQSKSNHHRAVLYVTGDALRVVDEISKGLIVDQTIEKVSFCAPDRNHEKGFAYICRDGTTRRWMCHGFLAVKESGERLSHAVGCAFAICLEKKQQREKEKVTVTYNENGTSFTRLGSFRQTTLTERLQDPQSAILAEPVPVKQIENPFALKRPHAPVDIMERQSSFRNFPKMAESSPFKRNISLRVNELPSTLERHRQVAAGIIGPEQQFASSAGVISVILEAEEQPDLSPVTSPANQLSDEFAGLSTGTVGHNPQSTTQPAFATPLVNNFTTQAPAINPLSANLQPMSTAFAHPAPQQAVNLASANLNPSVQPYPRQPIPNAAMQGVNLPSQPALPQPLQHVSPVIPSAAIPNMVAVNTNPSMQRAPLAASPAVFMPQPVPAQLVSQFSGNQFLQNGAVAPVRVSNPWADSTRLQSYPASTVAAVVVSSANASTASGKISDAEYWLNSTASQIDPFAAAPHVGGRQTSVRARPGVSGVGVGGAAEQVLLPHFGAVAPSIEPTLTLHSPPFAGHSQQVTTTGMVVGAASHPQAALVNSPMMFATSAHTPQAGTIAAAAAAASVHPQHQQPVNSMGNANFNATVTARLDSGIPKTAPDAALDPFESAWAAKSTSRGAMPVSAASNPFQGGMDKVTPAFQLKL